MVIPSPAQGKDSEIDGHVGVVAVVLRCGESAINCSYAAEYQLAMLCVGPVTNV